MGWGRAEQPGPSARPAGWMDLEMALGRRQWGIGEVRWTSPLPALAGQGSYPLRPLGCPCSLSTPPVPPPGGQVATPTLQSAPPHMGSLPGVAGGNCRSAVGGSSVGGGVGSIEQGGGHRLEGVCVVPGGQGRACQSPRAPPRPKQTRAAAARGQRALGLPRKERLGSYGGPISQFVHLRPVRPWACPSLGPSHAGPGPSMPILP